ncbi:MAG: hypothetical protein ACRDS0_04305 [Pseudonocardiaceae bacterium]
MRADVELLGRPHPDPLWGDSVEHNPNIEHMFDYISSIVPHRCGSGPAPGTWRQQLTYGTCRAGQNFRQIEKTEFGRLKDHSSAD